MNTDMLRGHGHVPRGPGADYGNIPDTGTRGAVADALEDARQAWRAWQDAWTNVQRAMRAAGMSTARIRGLPRGHRLRRGRRPVARGLARRDRGEPPVTASSATPEFDRLLLEAIDIAGRTHDRLADGAWPDGPLGRRRRHGPDGA